ncbi:MAG TPA: hypothetical protein VFU05_02445 [Cyclobacteriaceae bacterium]|nr:hypothetical protein [Cyclobacteriaceae bacterium]
MKPKKEYDLDDIIRAFAIGIAIMMVASKCQAQTVTLPSWVADSLIFETFKGRQCSLVVEAQADEINKLGMELLANGKALELSGNQIKTLEALVKNLLEGQAIERKESLMDKQELKKKVKKRNLVIIAQGVLLIVLVL